MAKNQRKGHPQAKDIQEWIDRQAGRKGELRAALGRLRTAFRKRELRSHLWWHAVGTDVLMFFSDGSRHYDEKVVRLLAEACGAVEPPDSRRVSNIIWQARKIATNLTREQIEDWARQKNNEGRPLSTYHVHCLVSVPDESERAALLKDCLDESWSVAELRFQIQNRLGGKRSRGGRHLDTRVASEPRVALQEIRLCARNWLARHKAWFDDEKAPLRRVRGQLQSDALEDLNRAKAEISEVQKSLVEELKCLGRLAGKTAKKRGRNQ